MAWSRSLKKTACFTLTASLIQYTCITINPIVAKVTKAIINVVDHLFMQQI